MVLEAEAVATLKEQIPQAPLVGGEFRGAQAAGEWPLRQLFQRRCGVLPILPPVLLLQVRENLLKTCMIVR